MSKRTAKEAVETDLGNDEILIQQRLGAATQKSLRKSMGIQAKIARSNDSTPVKKRHTDNNGGPFFGLDYRRSKGGEEVGGGQWYDFRREMPRIDAGHLKCAPTIAFDKASPLKKWTLWELLKCEGAAAGKLKTALHIEGIASTGASVSTSMSSAETSSCALLRLSIWTYAEGSFKKEFYASKQSPSEKNYKVFTDAANCKYPGAVVFFGGSNWLLHFGLSGGGVLSGKNPLGECAGWNFSSKLDASFILPFLGDDRSVKNTLENIEVKLFLISAPGIDLLPTHEEIVFNAVEGAGKLIKQHSAVLTGVKHPPTAHIPSDSIAKAFANRKESMEAGEYKAVSSQVSTALAPSRSIVASKTPTSNLMSSTASVEFTTGSAELTEEMKTLIRSEVSAQMNAFRNELFAGIPPVTATPFGFGETDIPPVTAAPFEFGFGPIGALSQCHSSRRFVPPIAARCPLRQFGSSGKTRCSISSQTEDFESPLV